MTLRSLGRLLAWVPWILVLASLVLFALSNMDEVRLSLFAVGSVDISLSVAVLGAMAIGFFLGGLMVWFTSLRHRRRARRAEATVRLLEAKHQELAARTPAVARPG